MTGFVCEIHNVVIDYTLESADNIQMNQRSGFTYTIILLVIMRRGRKDFEELMIVKVISA